MVETQISGQGKPYSIDRLLRLKSIAGPTGIIPISFSTWWAGVAAGRFPQPIRIGRVTCWRESDIAALIDAGITQKPKVG